MKRKGKNMADTLNTENTRQGINLRGILPSLILNIAIPLLLYFLVKRYISSSDVIALSVAALFPIFDSIYGVVRQHSLDAIAILSLVGTGASLVSVLLGGSAQFLLIKESFFTGALGLACFVSLLFPRPLMFYIGRQFIAGRDPEKIARFNAQAQHPYGRFVHRLITAVWGIAYVGEFIIRVILVYTLPPALVLAISPIILTGVTVATLAWTFAYVRYATRRGAELRLREQSTRVAQRR